HRARAQSALAGGARARNRLALERLAGKHTPSPATWAGAERRCSGVPPAPCGRRKAAYES
ncbi:MAG: hypothetical protein WCK86_13795, partial [Planctomycetia bacterium]